jgi:hypothetical protein
MRDETTGITGQSCQESGSGVEVAVGDGDCVGVSVGLGVEDLVSVVRVAVVWGSADEAVDAGLGSPPVQAGSKQSRMSASSSRFMMNLPVTASFTERL